jgi:hypothetical protein
MSISNPGENRYPAAPGPGGFPGGVGGYLGQPAQSGTGYGGGAPGNAASPNAGNGTYSYFNSQLTPLVGGAGGGGGYQGTALAGGNGGGGGGAIRIVSSTSISVNGQITTEGGNTSFFVATGLGSGGLGGKGAGGAIHLVAPTVSGAGLLVSGSPLPGVVEISAASNTFPATNVTGMYVSAGLYAPPLPTGAPAIQVTSVAGVLAPQYPQASQTVPDVTINSATPVTVAIAAQNIPTSTTISLFLTSENGPDSTITCGALSGTIGSSTATCTSVNFPPGVTVTNIVAVW